MKLSGNSTLTYSCLQYFCGLIHIFIAQSRHYEEAIIFTDFNAGMDYKEMFHEENKTFKKNIFGFQISLEEICATSVVLYFQ